MIKAQNNEIRQAQKRICSWALSSALVLALFFLFLHEKAVAKGLVLGALFSIFNFLLLGRSISLLLGQSRRTANAIGLASTLARYGLLAIPMVVALKSISFDFLAVVIGIFAVQIVTLIDFVLIKPLLAGK